MIKYSAAFSSSKNSFLKKKSSKLITVRDSLSLHTTANDVAQRLRRDHPEANVFESKHYRCAGNDCHAWMTE
jgi:hypothetical protein